MSLLKRIEQGQTRGGDQSSQSSKPAAITPTGASGGSGEQGGGLSALQARRVSAPNTSPQAGTYFDL